MPDTMKEEWFDHDKAHRGWMPGTPEVPHEWLKALVWGSETKDGWQYTNRAYAIQLRRRPADTPTPVEVG